MPHRRCVRFAQGGTRTAHADERGRACAVAVLSRVMRCLPGCAIVCILHGLASMLRAVFKHDCSARIAAAMALAYNCLGRSLFLHILRANAGVKLACVPCACYSAHKTHCSRFIRHPSPPACPFVLPTPQVHAACREHFSISVPRPGPLPQPLRRAVHRVAISCRPFDPNPTSEMLKT